MTHNWHKGIVRTMCSAPVRLIMWTLFGRSTSDGVFESHLSECLVLYAIFFSIVLSRALVSGGLTTSLVIMPSLKLSCEAP